MDLNYVSYHSFNQRIHWNGYDVCVVCNFTLNKVKLLESNIYHSQYDSERIQ